MYITHPTTEVDKLVEDLRSPVDEIFKKAYCRLVKIPGLSSTVVDMYLDRDISEQEFKSAIRRWILYE
jgi:hypothetical protein